jgi:16S rRNA (uracil1498-N3)-methyltransferase
MHQYFFYVAPDQIKNNTAVLSGDDFRHCVQVLRHKSGDHIQLINGQGVLINAALQSVSQRSCSCKILSVEEIQNSIGIDINLAFGLLKVRALEELVRSAAALGVSRIIPLNTDNSVKQGLNSDRLQKIAIEAIKQSGNFHLPKIESSVPFSEWVTPENLASLNLIAEQGAGMKMAESIRRSKNVHSINLLIGPEGGFSQAELILAQNAGYSPVRIHPYRLRSEVAALLAVAGIITLIE